MLYWVAAILGLLAGTNALTIGTAAAPRTLALKMKLERKPGEGDPFCDGIRKPADGPRPDQGQARFTADAGYIEADDEPWHSTCRPKTAVITKGVLDSTLTSALPFLAPEDALLDALRAATDDGSIKSAVEACLSAGGRPGCPAIDTADKMLAEFKKDGKFKKPPPAKKTAQGKGFDDMARALGKVHDNSV